MTETLSDKIITGVAFTEDIAEFIQKLREDLFTAMDLPNTSREEMKTLEWVYDRIDFHAGSKFTDNSPQTKPQGSREGNLDVIKRRDKTEDTFKKELEGKNE